MKYRIFLWGLLVLTIIEPSSNAQTGSEPGKSSPPTRTIVADLLMIDGDFYVVRGERGEIRIEVTPNTTVTEEFKFGDRIKAVVLPNDKALLIERAGPDEPTGITVNKPHPSRAHPDRKPLTSQFKEPIPSSRSSDQPSLAPKKEEERIIVADLLMIDGDFYVVRGERGEIRIEVTPDTKVSEAFAFGDRIKAAVLPNDKALWIERAKPDDQPGIYTKKSPPPTTRITPPQPPSTRAPQASKEDVIGQPKGKPGVRTIVADLLMVDGDFYVVRGERGEIRIEITPDTKLTEAFEFGDKIKAKVLPNDKAISVERAKPDEPVGIFVDPTD